MPKGNRQGSESKRLGRQTIDDSWLGPNRDALLNMLCFGWPDVGWQLTRATNREELRFALQPLRDHTNKHLINRLLRPTNATADAIEIRRKRISLKEALKDRFDTQSQHERCVTECREIEAALWAARADQAEFVQREFCKRRARCQSAQTDSASANLKEQILENELLDKEAAFAQDELLTFVKRGKYALQPLNLANAMAGLPFGTDVPFLGVWTSHARCSSLECPGWPSYRYQVFQTIESLWKKSKLSSIPRSEFFRQQIKSLPKKVLQTHPTIGTHKMENYVRTYLSENFWDLQRAIERSLIPNDDPRPIHFVIASNFDKCFGESKTFADLAKAKAARISD